MGVVVPNSWNHHIQISKIRHKGSYLAHLPKDPLFTQSHVLVSPMAEVKSPAHSQGVAGVMPCPAPRRGRQDVLARARVCGSWDAERACLSGLGLKVSFWKRLPSEAVHLQVPSSPQHLGLGRVSFPTPPLLPLREALSPVMRW